MVSTLNFAHDFKSVPIPSPPRDDIDQDISQELASFARRRAKTISRDVIGRGHVVRIDIDGPTSRLRGEDVSVVVGSGMFDAVLEDALIGLEVGSTASIESASGTATVTVRSAQSRELPELSDELVVDITEGRFTSVNNYRQTRTAEEVSSFVDEQTWIVVDEVIALSDVSIENQDVQILVESEMERCRVLAAADGDDFDSMTGEDLGVRVGVETMSEFIVMLESNARRWIAGALLGATYTGQELGPVTAARATDLWNEAYAHVRPHVLEYTTGNGRNNS